PVADGSLPDHVVADHYRTVVRHDRVVADRYMAENNSGSSSRDLDGLFEQTILPSEKGGLDDGRFNALGWSAKPGVCRRAGRMIAIGMVAIDDEDDALIHFGVLQL